MVCSISVVIWLNAMSLHAESVKEETRGVLDPVAKTKTGKKINDYHDQVFHYMDASVQHFDSYFGDDDIDDEDADSSFKLKLYLKIQKGSPTFRIDPSFDACLKLPHLEKRFNIIIDNMSPEELPGIDPTDKNDQLGITLRSHLKRQKYGGIKLDGGVKWRGKPVLYSQLKFNRDVPVKKWVASFKQKGYWFSDDGFGEMSQMDWDRKFGGNQRLGTTTAAKWSETSKGVEFEQSVMWGWVLEEDVRGISVNGSVFAHKSSTFIMDNYRCYVTYRTRIYQHWLYFEVTPQLEFPSDEGYHPTPSIMFGLDVYFRDQPDVDDSSIDHAG